MLLESGIVKMSGKDALTSSEIHTNIELSLIQMTKQIAEIIERKLTIFKVYDHNKHLNNFGSIIKDILKFV